MEKQKTFKILPSIESEPYDVFPCSIKGFLSELKLKSSALEDELLVSEELVGSESESKSWRRIR